MSELLIEQCDPREREREIKSLFAQNGRPQFDTAFERAYRPLAAQGLRSWIGLLDGKPVMHISVTPMRFVGGGRMLVGGMLRDLMVNEENRDFWTPVRLLRTVVSDLKKSGQIDFLFTTSIADAEPVFKAGGFKEFGTLRRYVFPLSRLYLAFARLRGRVSGRRAVPSEMHVSGNGLTLPEGSTHWRPQSDPEYYNTRIRTEEFADASWIAVGNRDRNGLGWAMLSRNQKLPELNLADAFWNEKGIRLGEVVHAAGRWGRKQRFKKLTLTTLQESHVALELERTGWFPRAARSKFLVQRISKDSPPPVEHWFLPGFALSTW